MKVYPNAPSHPCSETVYPEDHWGNDHPANEVFTAQHLGMPIRLEIASRIMAGFATRNYASVVDRPEACAEDALAAADALIDQHNKSLTPKP